MEYREQRIFTARDKMESLITANYRLLNMLSRFGISLGVGDKSIEEVCRINGVDCKTFLAVGVCKTAINLGKSAFYAKCEDLATIGTDTLEDLKHIDFLVIDDFADAVTMYNNVGSVLNSILETRAAADLPTVLVTPFPKSELVNKCDMRISGKLQSAKLISSEGR